MANKKKLIRISDLVKATGVSMHTIHYYLREGLLPPPDKTARNMAYYSPEYIENIHLIKELQEKRYLPLSVIKLMLNAKREGKEPDQLQDMRLSLEELFRPLGSEEKAKPVAQADLLSMTGLSATTIEKLEAMTLLKPVSSQQGKSYDGLDVRIARAVKTLLDLGLDPEDMSIYRQYMDMLRAETTIIREKVFHARGDRPRASGGKIMEVLNSLKASLAARVYRQAALEFNGREMTENDNAQR